MANVMKLLLFDVQCTMFFFSNFFLGVMVAKQLVPGMSGVVAVGAAPILVHSMPQMCCV